MWYLDLVLLRILGHQSVYANRLDKMHDAIVPWGHEPPKDEVDLPISGNA
jgi:hypothetical protein